MSLLKDKSHESSRAGLVKTASENNIFIKGNVNAFSFGNNETERESKRDLEIDLTKIRNLISEMLTGGVDKRR